MHSWDHADSECVIYGGNRSGVEFISN